MDFSKITSLNNYTGMLKMKTMWQNNKNNPHAGKNAAGSSAMSGVNQSDNRLAGIINKMNAGKDLSYEDMEYLRINNPVIYEEALKLRAEKEAYEKSLRQCETRDEVRIVHMGKIAETLTAAKNGDPMANAKMNIVTGALVKFTASSEYAHLPENEIELKEASDAETPKPPEKEETDKSELEKPEEEHSMELENPEEEHRMELKKPDVDLKLASKPDSEVNTRPEPAIAEKVHSAYSENAAASLKRGGEKVDVKT